VNLLAPLFLLLGAGAAVPLLLHLMRRRAGARIEFPAVRYLARAEREHSRRLRLRNLLLMLLRVAAVLAIALAAARPVSRLIGALSGRGGAGGGHAPAAIAVVLDNSLSTSVIIGGRPVLARLKEAVNSVLNQVSAGDRVWLLTADGTVHGGTAAAVRAALGRTEALAGAGDPPSATARGAALASALARSAGLGDAVVAVATDGQATTWDASLRLGEGNAARAVVYVPSGAPPANHAVADVQAQPTRWTPRGAIVARLTGVTDSASYRIDLNGRTLARGTASAGDPVVSVHAAPAARGWVAGSVSIEPDELRADDIRHFALWIGPPPIIAVDSSAGPFVRDAIATLVSTGRAATSGEGSGMVNVVSADRLATLPALVAAPSDPVRVGAANRALEHAGIPWRFGAVDRVAADARGLGTVAVGVSVRYALVPHGAASGDTLARVGGAPWIVAGPGYVVVGSPLDAAATTFPLTAAFVPWLADVVTQRLGGAGGGVIDAVPGATVARPAWADAWEAADGTLRTFDGVSVTLPTASGVYFLRRDGARVGAVVVNGEARESELRRLTPSEMAGRFQAKTRVLGDAGPWVAAVFDGGAGRPLMTPLLILALVLLGAESALTRKTLRKY
jgi:hypothetical protein